MDTRLIKGKCPYCNGRYTEEDGIYQQNPEAFICPECEKIFWVNDDIAELIVIPRNGMWNTAYTQPKQSSE